MLIYRRTSLLESTAQTLVNTVNCVGVMGKGLAHMFREREPEMFETYKKICDQKLLEPGKLWLWRGSANWILNFPTKKHWRHPSKLEWIESGLQKFVSAYHAQGIREISFPRLGCGNGGLDWADVQPLMERYLNEIRIPVYIHDFTVDIGLPEHLEDVAKQISEELPVAATFDAFVHALRRATELGENRMVNLSSSQPFQAQFEGDGELLIEGEAAAWRFEQDDLRGVWVGLNKGLVTSERAAWPVGGGGTELLSLLSLLPQVRPVQIEKACRGQPEVAIELRPEFRQIATAVQSEEQRELQWG